MSVKCKREEEKRVKRKRKKKQKTTTKKKRRLWKENEGRKSKEERENRFAEDRIEESERSTRGVEEEDRNRE